MFDVCVIGSGAGGGMAAKILTEGGLSVVMLEAGPPLYPEKDFKMMMWPYESPHRGVGVGGRAAENFGEFLRRMGHGKLKVNLTPRRVARISNGFDRGSWAAERITGEELPCDLRR